MQQSFLSYKDKKQCKLLKFDYYILENDSEIPVQIDLEVGITDSYI